MVNLSNISILLRREIEARITVPIIKAFIKEFGTEQVFRIIETVIKELAQESGIQLARLMDGDTIKDFANGLELWKRENALKIEVVEETDRTYFFNVTNCKYAEMYREAGLLEFGGVLSCCRDYEMIKGFNPKMKLTRTQTIMEGEKLCDFRIKMEKE